MERRELLARHAVDLPVDILRLLDLFAQPHLAVLHAAAPLEIEDVVDLLQDHRDALEPVGQLGAHGRQSDAADLLK